MGREDMTGRPELLGASINIESLNRASAGSMGGNSHGDVEEDVSLNSNRDPGARSQAVETGSTRVINQETCSRVQGSQLGAPSPEDLTYFSPTSNERDSMIKTLDSGLPDKKVKKVKGRKAQRLRSKHAEMTSVREDVLVKREELQTEYGYLNQELEVVRGSQEEMMNVLKDIMTHMPANEGQQLLLDGIWKRVNTDAMTLMERQSRIRQLENLLVEPQTQLI